MPFYTCARSSWTPTATADGSIFGGADRYDGYTVAASPAIARIIEIMEGGEASTSTVNVMVLRRHSTAATTPTAKTPAEDNPSSPANIGTYHQTASTQPTPANATHLANLTINSFGGVLLWVAPPNGGKFMVGGSTGNTEISISAVSGTPGVISTHFVVEEL